MGAKDLELVDALKPLGKAFAKDTDVVHYKATSLCVGKKVFAMIVNDELVVKRLPAIDEPSAEPLLELSARAQTTGELPSLQGRPTAGAMLLEPRQTASNTV